MSRRGIAGSMAIVFSILFLAVGCAKQPDNIIQVMEISLSTEEKAHALDLAAAFLAGTTIPDEDRQRYPNIYTSEERGVFVSLLRENRSALTAFAWDDSIFLALKKAARILKRLAVNEDLSAVRLRIDIVRQTNDEMSRNIYQRWSTTNLYLYRQGLLLETKPLLGILADELEDYGLIAENGDFSETQLKKFLKARGLGKTLRTQLLDEKADEKHPPVVELKYVRFSALSFMRDKEGQVVDLWRNDAVDEERYKPTGENIARALSGAVAYLKECRQADKQFAYIYNPVVHQSEKYNDRRHAAIIVAMLQWMEANNSRELLPNVQWALSWLVDHSRPPALQDRQNHDWRAVEFFVRLDEQRRRQMKLGATGLALAAFSRYTLLTGDRQYLPLMRQYAEFLDFMMKDNGECYTDYINGELQQEKGDTESYFAGEAVFGLVSFFRVDQDPRWLTLAMQGIDFQTAPENVRNQGDDNWLVYAIAELSTINPASLSQAQIEYLRGAAAQLHRQFNATAKPPDLAGSFAKPELATTGDSARRLEVAATLIRLGELWSDPPGLDLLREMYLKGISFLLRNQYNEINTMFFTHPSVAVGGFIYSYRSPVVHLETMQNVMSALLAAQRIAAKN